MKYMVMIYGSREAWAALSREAGEAIGSTHRAVQEELEASGELIDHKELAVDGARVVRRTAGTAEVEDGPFTEGREILGGYYLVDVAGAGRAVEIAARFDEAEFAPVEVRLLSGGSSWDSGPQR